MLSAWVCRAAPGDGPPLCRWSSFFQQPCHKKPDEREPHPALLLGPDFTRKDVVNSSRIGIVGNASCAERTLSGAPLYFVTLESCITPPDENDDVTICLGIELP